MTTPSLLPVAAYHLNLSSRPDRTRHRAVSVPPRTPVFAAPPDVHPECRPFLYDGIVTSQPAGYRDQHDLIHLGGETAVVVPVDEYRRLRALEHRASADDLDAAEADAVLQQHDVALAGPVRSRTKK